AKGVAADTGGMVGRAKKATAAGVFFQVVLSQRFEGPSALPPFSLYRALRRVNPAPFLFFLDYGGFAIAGSSPEILVRLRGSTVRSEEHTSQLQSLTNLVCRLLLATKTRNHIA